MVTDGGLFEGGHRLDASSSSGADPQGRRGTAAERAPSSASAQVTQLLQEWADGDLAARDRLMVVVYDELRRLARRYMRRESPGHTLQTTAVVNEAYVRLAAQQVPGRNRAQFLGLVAQQMRRILIDHARARRTARRGGNPIRVSFDESAWPGAPGAAAHALDLLGLDDALTELARLDPRQARIVELRFFAGLTIEETAEAIGVSHTIVERDWAMARAWLRRTMRTA
jgi:RNA polymerase sigma factor (TIGR02999 family)